MDEINNTEKKEEVKSQAAKSNERLTPSNNVKSNEKLKASTSSKKKKKGSKKPLISLLLILILATSLALAFLYLEPGKGGIFGSYNDIDPDNTHTHDFSECVYTMAPTCYSNGMAEYRCSCGETKTEELISTLVHSVDSKICKGCATDVIYVTKPEDLFYFREDGYYILLNDIDLGGQEWTQKCSDDAPFSGTFDGGGYTIYNFTTNANTGFFYYNNGIIKNLGLRDFSIVGGGSYFGCLVGKNDGIIENCFVEGEINIIPSRYSTDGFGGLVGINYGSIVRSYTDINITCYMQSVYLGGLVGDNHGAISECYATGDITMTYVKDGRIGGLVGYDAGGSISNCYASGDINVAYGEKSFVGGLVGSCHDNSSITNCYASSSITNTISKEYSLDDAYTSIGGFVGYGTATIENCFASGNIYSACKTRSHYVGGFIGEESATLINCYRAEEQQIEMITYTGAGNYYTDT